MKRSLENSRKVRPRGRRFRPFDRLCHLRLHPFQVPIAEFVPEKVIDRIGSFVETEIFKRLVYLTSYRAETRKYPPVGEQNLAARRGHGTKTKLRNGRESLG